MDSVNESMGEFVDSPWQLLSKRLISAYLLKTRTSITATVGKFVFLI